MLVVFEGIDGSGKTTISNQVTRRLRARGLTVEHVREGGTFASPITQGLREFGRDVRNLDLTPEAELFLYVTRDVQLLEEVTRPALRRSNVVIADRFLYSAEVLARFGRGLPATWVGPIVTAAARGLTPDLVVLIDVDPHVARARRRVAKLVAPDAKPPSRKGLGGVGMQQRFRAGYRTLAAADPGRWLVIDNEGPLEATIDRVFRAIHDARTRGVPEALARARVDAPTEATSAQVAVSTPAEALDAFLALVDRRAAAEPHVAAYLLAGLHGGAVDDRRRAWVTAAPETIAHGLSGLVDDVSWELRERLAPAMPGRVARSLGTGTHGDPRAAALRERLADAAAAEALLSLDGLDDDLAWRLRERHEATQPDATLESLARLGHGRAWAMRERWIARRGAATDPGHTLGSYAAARVISRSLTGVEDDRAWELREAARAAAPVAALASLRGTTGERAWELRARYVDRAPKVILDTVGGSDDDRAWAMREAAVARCKEALDSIDAMDGERAWRLREDNLDLWPSTAVKTLGPLATTPRGVVLVREALGRHPRNLSLLKHAAAIALGAHARPDAFTE